MNAPNAHWTAGSNRPAADHPGATRGLLASIACLAITLGLLLLPPAPPLAADQVVRIERHSEMWSSGGELVLEGTEEGTLYLGTDRARFDQGSEASWILRRDEGTLLLLNHGLATFQELRVPVRLEDHFEGEELEGFRAIERMVAPEIEAVVHPERKQIDGWSARRVTLVGSPPESETRYEYELWVSRDLPIDEDLHGALLRGFGALHLAHRDVARAIAALDGFPIVRSSTVRRAGGGKDVDARRVIEVTRRDVEPELYEAPEGYRRVPFDPKAWVELTVAGRER